MKWPEFKYIDTAINGVKHRNNVIDLNLFKVPKNSIDTYRTIFRFDIGYLNHFNDKKSVSGYRGKCYADYLAFDIDSTDLNDSYAKAKQAIEMIRLDFEIDVEYLYFSGAKGFHILIPAIQFGYWKPDINLPEIHKLIAGDMLQDLHDSSIYDINRLFRVTNTINSKSNLFKIPLKISDFAKGLYFILEQAKCERTVNFIPPSDFVPNRNLHSIYDKFLQAISTPSQLQKKQIQHTSDESILAKLETGVVEGERNVVTARLAGFFKSKNIDKTMTTTLLKTWNLRNDPPMNADEIERCVNNIYKYESEQNGNGKDVTKDVKPIWAFSDDYENCVRREKQVYIGIPEIDEKIRGIRAGQVMTIMGFTGNFKTATLQRFLIYYQKYSKEPVIMFELEMSGAELFERSLQMEMKITGKQIESIFAGNDQEEKYMLVKYLQEKQPNFYVCDVPGLSIADIKDYCLKTQEILIKRKLGLVGVDFVQLMDDSALTQVQKINNIAAAMKNLAKELNLPIIVVSQVTGVQTPEEEITLMSSRDGKNIPINSDYVLGMWMKSETEQVIAILKNRRGPLAKVYRNIDRDNLNFNANDPIIGDTGNTPF